MIETILRGAALAVTFALGTGAAQAATCNISGNGNQKTIYTATQGAPDALVGANCRDGNDKNTLDNEGWILGDATDDGAGTQKVTLTLTGQGWSIDNPLGFTDLLFVLKQGSTFASFVVDLTKPLTGTWGTNGPGKEVNDLSHASVWYAGDPVAIPLPAGLPLLLAGLGALALVRRRKA